MIFQPTPTPVQTPPPPIRPDVDAIVNGLYAVVGITVGILTAYNRILKPLIGWGMQKKTDDSNHDGVFMDVISTEHKRYLESEHQRELLAQENVRLTTELSALKGDNTLLTAEVVRLQALTGENEKHGDNE